MNYKKLWQHMAEEHGLLLTESELREISIAAGVKEELVPKCGNENPPCAGNLKFGMLECTECDWGE